ncbi:MAG: hypothetical protein ACRCT8_05610 [Lacipirellulaceae bacterium]
MSSALDTPIGEPRGDGPTSDGPTSDGPTSDGPTGRGDAIDTASLRDGAPDDDAPCDGAARQDRWNDAAGWLASLVLHAAAVLLLAAATQPPRPPSVVAELDASLGEEAPIDDAMVLDASEDDVSTSFESPLVADSGAATDVESLASALATPLGSAANEPPSLATDASLLTPLSTGGVASITGTAGRTADSRGGLVAAKGGSGASEVAVARGLKWIADHQNQDGTWSLLHQSGACRGRCPNPAEVGDRGAKAFAESLRSGTALALLPFLGAGETHQTGRYRKSIDRGLRALVALGKPDPEGAGASWADSGMMYAHGLSAIVLTEAYGMTRDPDLRAPAQAAIDHLAFAQDPVGGGWRYTPQETGDTSVTGWQLMALKSAALAEINTPRRVADRAGKFLDSAASADGSSYRYTIPTDDEPEPRDPTPTLSAVGLLCRMYLGWRRDDERLERGLRTLAEAGPSPGNYYHNYYAAQALFHHTGGEGPLWRTWNERTREQLLAQQETRGHARGSWWVEGPHNARGGRLYTTALATMTLEVYYRYQPLYQSQAVDEEFPE